MSVRKFLTDEDEKRIKEELKESGVGTSVTVKGVAQSTEDGGVNYVYFSDGKSIEIRNGNKGSKGDTPVKGTDYFTDSDKAEIVSSVLANFTDASEVAM